MHNRIPFGVELTPIYGGKAADWRYKVTRSTSYPDLYGLYSRWPKDPDWKEHHTGCGFYEHVIERELLSIAGTRTFDTPSGKRITLAHSPDPPPPGAARP